MSGEKLNIEADYPVEDQVARPVATTGETGGGTLAEVFGLTFTDEDEESHARNMAKIAESEREADRIIRTL